MNQQTESGMHSSSSCSVTKKPTDGAPQSREKVLVQLDHWEILFIFLNFSPKHAND